MPFGAYKEDEKFYYVKGGRGEMKGREVWLEC